jgi:hypothetical protein
MNIARHDNFTSLQRILRYEDCVLKPFTTTLPHLLTSSIPQSLLLKSRMATFHVPILFCLKKAYIDRYVCWAFSTSYYPEYTGTPLYGIFDTLFLSHEHRAGVCAMLFVAR